MKTGASRVTARSGTKTKAVRYVRSKSGANMAIKATYPRHSKECNCRLCRRRNARKTAFPQD